MLIVKKRKRKINENEDQNYQKKKIWSGEDGCRGEGRPLFLLIIYISYFQNWLDASHSYFNYLICYVIRFSSFSSSRHTGEKNIVNLITKNLEYICNARASIGLVSYSGGYPTFTIVSGGICM